MTDSETDTGTDQQQRWGSFFANSQLLMMS